MTAPISKSAAITAVRAANAAGRAVEVTTLDGHTQHGTARWASSDQSRLVLFGVVLPPALTTYPDDGSRFDITDAKGVTFRFPPDQSSLPPNYTQSDLYSWWQAFKGVHPKPWSHPDCSLWVADTVEPPDDWFEPRMTTVYVDLSQIATIVSSTNWGVDPNLGTIEIKTAAGVHREKDPAWMYGTGLE